MSPSPQASWPFYTQLKIFNCQFVIFMLCIMLLLIHAKAWRCLHRHSHTCKVVPLASGCISYIGMRKMWIWIGMRCAMPPNDHHGEVASSSYSAYAALPMENLPMIQQLTLRKRPAFAIYILSKRGIRVTLTEQANADKM